MPLILDVCSQESTAVEDRFSQGRCHTLELGCPTHRPLCGWSSSRWLTSGGTDQLSSFSRTLGLRSSLTCLSSGRSRQTDAYMNGWMMDGWMDGWMDGNPTGWASVHWPLSPSEKLRLGEVNGKNPQYLPDRGHGENFMSI